MLTFKKSHLPEVLRTIPIDRIVLETDAPYMAPVPMRGKRNESSFLTYVIERAAECYGVTPERVAEATNANAAKIFPRCFEYLRTSSPVAMNKYYYSGKTGVGLFEKAREKIKNTRH